MRARVREYVCACLFTCVCACLFTCVYVRMYARTSACLGVPLRSTVLARLALRDPHSPDLPALLLPGSASCCAAAAACADPGPGRAQQPGPHAPVLLPGPTGALCVPHVQRQVSAAFGWCQAGAIAAARCYLRGSVVSLGATARPGRPVTPLGLSKASAGVGFCS